ncbi:hypothetical protein DNU06_10540 [Putridiphycobacter roseus]|uniref:Uncharacterized protein n=1 Tax=Putridiphycobacter roseus TaxID=2219161 RepID=A0A2W1MZ75_9FLAO|nr:hypothetical protein [Putridiphycobacter roseus]PZE16694.1 hypothetical protein DNU06_10540 [Putridiphycobacter roseus]
MSIRTKISNWFKPKLKGDLDNREFEWCIIGNIVHEHYWGEEKIIKRGTKQFRPGAKVYCMPEFGGMAHEDIRVIGKPRKQNRLINIVIRTRHIKSFRVQKVFHPKIQFDIGSHLYYWSNRRSKNEEKNLHEMVEYLNTLTEEIIKKSI